MKSPAPAEGDSRYLAAVTGAFVAVLLVSNVASSAKIINLGFSLSGIPIAFDGGTILFPLSYIFGDVLTEVYGYRKSRKVIWTGFVCLAGSALVFAAIRALPGDPLWESYAGQKAYDAILGGMSSGGIVAASLAGYFLGEFANSAALSRLKVAMKGRHLWVRTVSSTLIGEFLDTLAFVAIATVFGVFDPELFAGLLVTNYLFKCAVEVVMTPATYAVVGALKRLEGSDAYDSGVRYSPFSLKDD